MFIKNHILLINIFCCFGSDAHEPVNHLFIGSAPCESRPEFFLRLGALALEEETQSWKFVQRTSYYY